MVSQHKGRNRKAIRLAIPIVPEPQRIIDTRPTGDLTFLVNATGSPSPTRDSGTVCGSGAMTRAFRIARSMGFARPQQPASL
jgi:hypothetical protein